jgi:hypothetical protein
MVDEMLKQIEVAAQTLEDMHHTQDGIITGLISDADCLKAIKLRGDMRQRVQQWKELDAKRRSAF